MASETFKKQNNYYHNNNKKFNYDNTKLQELKKELRKNADQIKFDEETAVKRLVSQKDGDLSSFYLAIFSFLEGYLRHINHLNFDDKSKITYTDKFSGEERDITISINSILNQYIHGHKDFQYPINLDFSIKQKKDNTATLKFLAAEGSKDIRNGSYYVDANRIRHCFIEQSKDAVCAAVDAFVEFSKIFNLYNNYKTEIDSLINDENLHDAMIKREKSDDSINLEKENSLLSKIIKEFLEQDPNLKDYLNNSDLDEVIEKDELPSHVKEFLGHLENLRHNQDVLSYYASSWRNYQTTLSKLTDEQQQIENSILNVISNDTRENFAIQAGPGTGKTILLIDVLQKLVDKDILLLTYTNSLTKYNKFIASTINFSDKKLSEVAINRITDKIFTLDEYIYKKASELLNRKIQKISLNSDLQDINSKKIIEFIKNNMTENIELTPSAIYLEALREIWGIIPLREDYISKHYLGKEAKPEERPSRTEVWYLVKKLEKYLDEEQNIEIPFEYACFKLVNMTIPDSIKIDYLLIDEAQDLNTAKLNVISNLCRKNYILAGDLAQSVFVPRALSWNALVQKLNNKEAKMYKTVLRKNFRSTDVIQNLANNFFKSSDFIIKRDEIYSEGFMPGPLPDYKICSDTKDAIRAIKERISILKQELYFENKDFCIVASNKEELNLIKQIFGKDLPSCNMENKDFDFDKNNTIRLSTVKYVKGIDCPVMILLLSKDYENQQLNGNLDINAQFNGIYACITRAMNILSIYFANEDDFIHTPTNKRSSIKHLLKTLEEDGTQFAN